MSTEINTILDSTSNYKAYEFFRKFTLFIYSLDDDITEEEKHKFLNDLEKTGNDSSGNIILSIIDKLDNINKQIILANLVRSRASGLITIDDFFRLSSVLERIPYVDLKHLPRYQEEYYENDGDTELLYSTGVLRPSQYNSEGDKYILSPLGVKLMKYGIGIHVDIPLSVKGVSTEVTFNEIKDLPNTREVESIVNKIIVDRAYDEEQAQFDYDLFRGK